jgi:hypothetical protein
LEKLMVENRSSYTAKPCKMTQSCRLHRCSVFMIDKERSAWMDDWI